MVKNSVLLRNFLSEKNKAGPGPNKQPKGGGVWHGRWICHGNGEIRVGQVIESGTCAAVSAAKNGEGVEAVGADGSVWREQNIEQLEGKSTRARIEKDRRVVEERGVVKSEER